MAEVTIRAEFQTSVETVWNVVTDNERYGWRSDLEKIELSEDKNMFTEISRGGIKTDFTITEKKPFERYAFDMKNKNMQGRWTGKFVRGGNGGCIIEFTENVTAFSPVLNLFVKSYLKKQQKQYVKDLKKALGEEG